MFAEIVTVEVDNAENNEWEREATESLRGTDHEFGTFFNTCQLLSTLDPEAIFTFGVEVAGSDRGPFGRSTPERFSDLLRDHRRF